MNNRHIISAALLAMTLSVGTAHAAIDSAGNLGFGVALGQPMGATAKYWLDSHSAVDAMLGYHFTENFDMHADYLWHSAPLIPVNGGRVPLYMGLGGRILAGDDTQFGLRFPLGLTYISDRSDALEYFAEIAPIVKLNGLDFDIDGLVGVRVYFNP